MSNENTPVTNEDDLDAFSADFFGQNKPEPEQASEGEEQSNEDSSEEDATNENENLGEDDTPANEDDATEEAEVEEDEEDSDPAPDPNTLKKPKSRFQERIDELTGKAREAERREQALRDEFENLKRTIENQNQNDQPVPKPTGNVDTSPTPDDKNEDGSNKYPLGEFDPTYIRDLTKHTLESERKALIEQDKREAEERQNEEQKAQLTAGWQEKLGPAQERYPDFMTKGDTLVNSFSDLDQKYAEYLTATIMSLEYGPDVLYYLANNIDEARRIIDSGATKATVALGRIEAKFLQAEVEKQKVRPRVSKAPEPPAHLNKGNSVAKAEISDDTDDLDAFASKFFTSKKRRS